MQLTDQEMHRLNVYGGILAEALDRIWRKWGPLSEDELAAFFQGPHVEPALAAALARDFLRYFSGDAEGAAYSGAPRVRALVRALVLDYGPSRLPHPAGREHPGLYPGLGALLPALLAAGMDESWSRFLSSFLASPMGANARNELLHGFVNRVAPPTAALILIGALVSRQGRGPRGSAPPAEETDAQPPDGAGSAESED